MDDEGVTASVSDPVYEILEVLVIVVSVYSGAAFDCDWDGGRSSHRAHTRSHKCRISHQARAKPTRLHAITGATYVQIDLIVTSGRRKFRTSGQINRTTAPQLNGNWMLCLAVTQMPRGVPVHNSSASDHFGVQHAFPT